MRNTLKTNILTVLALSMLTAAGCTARDITPAEEPEVILSREEEILEGMSLTEKIEQMMVISLRYSGYDDESYTPLTELNGVAIEHLKTHHYGGVILFGGNIRSCDQTIRLIDEIKTAHREGSSIPLLIAADQEGGDVRRLTYGVYHCGNMALAASGSPETVRESAAVIAEELKAVGINTNFAPVVDVNSNPRNPIIGVRSFSDDPGTVSTMADAYIKGMQDENIISCIKHFPGHGDTDIDSHTGLPRVDASYDELKTTHLLPFAELSGDADMIMSAHIEFPMIDDTEYTTPDGSTVYLPATLSEKIITGILRNDLGYDGVVCTDAMGMDAIQEYYDHDEALVMAINAGVDILLIPVYEDKAQSEYLNDLDHAVNMLVTKAEDGTIPMERIDESVLRILKLKNRHGILDEKPAEDIDAWIASARQTVGSREHHEQEIRVSEQAVTLLKNDNSVLPLGADQTALVFVPYESMINSVLYTASYLEEEGLIGSADQINIVCYSYLSDYDIMFAIDEFEPDAVIYITSVYSIYDLYDSEIIRQGISHGHEYGIPQIVLSANLPYDLSLYDEADAHLACYLGSGMVEIPVFDGRENIGYGPNVIAALSVMYNDAAPRGRLPVQVPLVEANEDGYDYADEIYYHRNEGSGY
ncbi:MAG: glycoside hydrolase family 3 protein [Solobacterium sp.]|nr:glycoside hydrolase family 3 protein [Solobacterium sp.]